jgi:hypothetical protein
VVTAARIGRRIRASALADLIQWKRPNFSAFEHGRRDIRLACITAIAKFMNVNPEYLGMLWLDAHDLIEIPATDQRRNILAVKLAVRWTELRPAQVAALAAALGSQNLDPPIP